VNKSEFIQVFKQKLAEKKFKNFDPNEAGTIVDLFVDFITQALQAKNRVEFRGFGVFELRPYKGYNGINPKTKAPIKVGGKSNPFFKCGKYLSNALKGDS
jgi:integration host factor subunit beta